MLYPGPPIFESTAIAASMSMVADPDDISAVLQSLAEMLGVDPDLLEVENVAIGVDERRTSHEITIHFKVYATPLPPIYTHTHIYIYTSIHLYI